MKLRSRRPHRELYKAKNRGRRALSRGRRVLPKTSGNDKPGERPAPSPSRRSARIKKKCHSNGPVGILDVSGDQPGGFVGAAGISLTASTEYVCYNPTTRQHCWAVTSLKAPFYEPSARAGVDIVAVIDKSGSMRGEKIRLVRETLLFVIDQLKESDRICLVVYDTNVELVFGLMKMTEQNRKRARAYISSIVEGSMTNLYGGLIKGMEQIALTNGGEKAQVQSVLLLTDGLANYGIKSTSQIIEQMKLVQSKGLGAVSRSSEPPLQKFLPVNWNFGYMASQAPTFQQNSAPPPLRQAPVQRQHQTVRQLQRQTGPPIRQAPVRQQQVVRSPVRQAPVRQQQVVRHPVRQAPVRQQQVVRSPVRQAPVRQQKVVRHPVRQAPVRQQQVVRPSVRQAPVRQQQVVRRQAPVRQIQRQAPQPPLRRSSRHLKKQATPPSAIHVAQLQYQQQARMLQQKAAQLSPWQTSFQLQQPAAPSGSHAPFNMPFGASLPSPPLALSQSKEDDVTAGYKFDGTVYTFGFGSDHDADMLEAISTQGGGVYYYIDTNEKIPESFADCLGGLLSVMGQNVSVKLEAQGDTSFKKVHTSKAINWTMPQKRCEITMGDIQSEESRDLVLELELPPLPSGIALEQVPLVKAEVSYFNVITSQSDTIQCQVTTNRTDGDHGPGNMTVDIQRNRVRAADALKRAEELGDKSKLKDAQNILKDAIAALKASISKDEGLVMLLLLDLNKCLKTMNTRESYTSHGKNYMRSKQQTHLVQRSNFVYGGKGKKLEAFGYGNVSKKAYRLKAKCKK